MSLNIVFLFHERIIHIFKNKLKYYKLQLTYNRFCEFLYFKITKHDFITTDNM